MVQSQNRKYEKVTGKITPERYASLASGYEQEQSQLKLKLSALESQIDSVNLREECIRKFMSKAEEYIEMPKLTSKLLRTFIRRVEVYEKSEKYSKTCGNTIAIHKALISMLENIEHDSIIVADRNYDSYNNIAHFESKGLKYVIRIKSTVGIVQKFNLLPDKETDLIADIVLTRKQTKKLSPTLTNIEFSPRIQPLTFFLKIQKIHIRSNSGS